MKNSPQHCLVVSGNSVRKHALAVTLLSLLAIVSIQPLHAQMFTVLHQFTGQDGASPGAGLSIDRGGNLYGTTANGGNTGGNCGTEGCGTVFKLIRHGSQWTLSLLYKFQGGQDGSGPSGRVVFGPDGTLYGATLTGGIGCDTGGCGVAYRLRPSATACGTVLCPWNESIVYHFTGADGAEPVGDLVFDPEGNIYGALGIDGAFGDGAIYELSPTNGSWTESVLYSFTGGQDGSFPFAGVALDSAGNVYGTTGYGGNQNGYGVAFALMHSGSGWSENVLHTFDGSDGRTPSAAPLLNTAGNVYGTTEFGGLDDSGTSFELTPSGGTWSFNSVYAFNGSGGPGPVASLVMDSAGNLYGTNYAGGSNGYVFKLTRTQNGWQLTPLYYFSGGSDGGGPRSSIVFDSSGNLYGTASSGGDLQCNHGLGCGVVWEITP